MSQNSLVINDASGAAVLSAINAALDTLASNNGGAGAPAVTYPYMWWPDTANGVLRQRNTANTGWIVRGPLAETLVVARTANTALAAADFGRCIIASGTWTQGFNASSTLGDGWFVEYRNNGTGVITLDPFSSETVDGVATLQLAPGETCCIYSNGTALYTLGRTASATQSQTATAFTSAGTAPSFTLTPVPALTAYAAGQRFRVRFHSAGAGSDTLNISTLGAKSLKQYDATGAKVAAVIAAGQLADVEYDGVDFVILDPLPAAVPSQVGIQGACKNLRVSTTGLSANVSVSADEITLENAGGNCIIARAVNLTINCAAAGAGGLDTGTLLAAASYSVWVIWNGSAVSGLLSASATTPTLPNGYTHYARVGWVRTDGTANKYPYPFVQYGRTAEYVPTAGSNLTSYFVVQSGTSSGTVSLAGYTPPTASAVLIAVKSSPAADSFISAGKTAADVTSNRIGQISATSATATYEGNTVGRISYAVASQIYVISTGAANSTRVLGWEDNL